MKKILLAAVLLVTAAPIIPATPAIPRPNDPDSFAPLSREELKLARISQKGGPCGLTCNRAHNAGRDDLIRKGYCAE